MNLVVWQDHCPMHPASYVQYVLKNLSSMQVNNMYLRRGNKSTLCYMVYGLICKYICYAACTFVQIQL